MTDCRTWLSADGLIGLELDADGLWIRRREARGDMWGPPERLREVPTAAGEAAGEAAAVRRELFSDPFVSDADYGRLVEDAADADERRSWEAERDADA